MDNFVLYAIEELYRLCTKMADLQVLGLAKLGEAHALLFECYFVFWFIQSVCQFSQF